eukprot:COSAG02_NODE_6893_length_3302_cov_4.198876_1_plen_744_part_00
MSLSRSCIVLDRMARGEGSSALERVLAEEAKEGEEGAFEYPEGFDVIAAALGEPQPGEVEREERRRQEEDDGWLQELARAGSGATRAVEAREFLEVPEGESDISSCWSSSDQGCSDEAGPDDTELFDPTAAVRHGIDHGTRLPLEHMGHWHAYQKMEVALESLIALSATGPRAASPGTARVVRARSPEAAAPLAPRVINRVNRKETQKGIFFPRPAESWGGSGRAWRPDKHWERNTRQLADSLIEPLDVAELGQRLVSAAQDWADVQRRERSSRGQLSAVTNMLSSVRNCLENIHGGSLDVTDLKPYFERMLRHVQHLYIASTPPAHRMHGGELPPHLPYRDVADRKYHAKPPVPSHYVDKTWARRAPACRPAPKRQTKAQAARAARLANKSAEEADALGETELMQLLDAAQNEKVQEPTEGAGFSARAVSKVLGKPPGTWSWEDDHPDPLVVARRDALSKTEAASAPVGKNKRPPSKFKVRAQLQEELTAARQGVAGLEEKATQLRAQLDAALLAEQAEAAERDTVVLAETLAGVMDSTEVLLGAAKAQGLHPPQSPAFTSQAAPRSMWQPAMEADAPQQIGAAAARRARRQDAKFAVGGYSYEQVTQLGGSHNLWQWEVEPGRENEQRAETWHYQGADARIAKARHNAMAEADPSRPVELQSSSDPEKAASTGTQAHRIGARRRKSTFRVEEKHLPTAGKFLFDGPGHAPRSVKYKAQIARNVQAAAEAKREEMRARGVGR